MSERDKLFPDPSRYSPLTRAEDYDAPHGGMDDEQRAIADVRLSRTSWAVGGAIATIVVGVGSLGWYAMTHQEVPPKLPTAEAPVVPGPSVSESPSESVSESPSPSPTKTSASPSPSKTSPSATPSPSATKTHRVTLPPITSAPVTTPAPETTPPPQECTWTEASGTVTVGECGDHTAYNDEARTGAHQLPVGMMFGNVCMKGSMVAVHYGGSYDLVDDNGYFPVPGPC